MTSPGHLFESMMVNDIVLRPMQLTTSEYDQAAVRNGVPCVHPPPPLTHPRWTVAIIPSKVKHSGFDEAKRICQTLLVVIAHDNNRQTDRQTIHSLEAAQHGLGLRGAGNTMLLIVCC